MKIRKQNIIAFTIAVVLSLALFFITAALHKGPYLKGFSSIIAFTIFACMLVGDIFTATSNWLRVIGLVIFLILYHGLIFLPTLLTSSFKNWKYIVIQVAIVSAVILLNITFVNTVNAIFGI